MCKGLTPNCKKSADEPDSWYWLTTALTAPDLAFPNWNRDVAEPNVPSFPAPTCSFRLHREDGLHHLQSYRHEAQLPKEGGLLVLHW